MVPHFTPAVNRFFTPGEAELLLSTLHPQLMELSDCVYVAREVVQGPCSDETRLELMRLQQRAQALVDALRGLGVKVRDLDPLTLAFPALYRGQQAFLCWRLGDERVERWQQAEQAPVVALADTSEHDWVWFS